MARNHRWLQADYAFSVAKKCGSDLIALHVIEVHTTVLGPAPPPDLIEMKKEVMVIWIK